MSHIEPVELDRVAVPLEEVERVAVLFDGDMRLGIDLRRRVVDLGDDDVAGLERLEVEFHDLIAAAELLA